MKILALILPFIYGINHSNTEINILEPYTGVWVSDAKEQDGKTFSYTYSLVWFDQKRTIAKLRIAQDFKDGSSQVLWAGFKGWNEETQSVYYEGFSTFGMHCTGSVYMNDEKLFTEYTATNSNGKVTKVRDVFSVVKDQSFGSETFILTDGKWKSFMTDKWTKI